MQMFFVAEGDGVAHVGSESRTIIGGDAAYVLLFAEHAFANTSVKEALRYVSVWWEDGPLVRRSEEEWNINDESKIRQ